MDRLIVVATHALSSAILAFSLTQHAGFDLVAGALVGVVAFLCLQHLYEALLFARARREMREDMNTLHAETLSVQTAFEDTKRRLIEVTTAIAQRASSHEKKVASELRAIERLLHAIPDGDAKGTAGTIIAAPAQARTLPDPAMLAMIRRALEENRVDLYLQPIVGLPQRKVRYYESLTRLRSADGGIVMPSQYIKVAAPAGLMSVIDNLQLLRCIQLVRRLTQRSRDIAVFCNISEHTLNDAEFFPQLLEFLRGNRDLAGQIVFEFAQETVLRAGKTAAAALKALHDIGFRLSIDSVTALDCDFAVLRRQGVHFVKLKARTLIAGMKQAQAPVAAEDFKSFLARIGIDLIVERVEEEKTVVQLLELNIDLGQGFLFGEPKPIRDVGDINAPRARELTATTAAGSARGLARRLAG